MWASSDCSLTFRTVEETLFSVIVPECLSPEAGLFTYGIVK